MVTTTQESKTAKNGKASHKKPPKSLRIAELGIYDSNSFTCLMSTIMTDLIEGSLSPKIANAVCNAGGKLLKMAEMEIKYGLGKGKDGQKILRLVPSQAIKLLK
jgi:hypothetical protein